MSVAASSAKLSQAVPQALPSRACSARVSLAIIVSLWLVIYLAAMFHPALLDDVDTVHAEAAREMVLRHDWVTLYTNGIRYLEKAPLMYWGMAVSYELFGVNDWSTRLPLMLGILAWLLATYALGRYAYGERAGRYAAVVLATSLGPFLFTRFLIPEILVGLWLTLGLHFFLTTLEGPAPSRLACWGLATTAALNVLTKGLIGLVFPATIIGLYLILTGNLRHLLRMRLVSSTAIMLAVAAPWHVLAALRNPGQGPVRGFLWFYFVNEHFLRYLNKRVPAGYDTVPLLLFWALLVLWLVPWSIFLPQAFAEVPHRLRDLRARFPREQRADLLFGLWSVVIVAFFSLSTRQEYYTIPSLPGMALLVGYWLTRETDSAADSPERRAGRRSSAVFLAVAIVCCLTGLFLLLNARAPLPGTDLADLLKRNPDEYNLALGHFLDLTGEAMGAFRGPLLGFVVALGLGAGLNFVFRRQGRLLLANTALALMMVGLLACVHAAFETFSPILSSQELAVAIQARYKPGDLIVVDGEYAEASTLNFYTGVPLRVLHAPSGNLWYGAKFPDAPQVFETPDSFRALWAGPAKVFLWSSHDDPPELQGTDHYLMARSGGKSIFTNREPGR